MVLLSENAIQLRQVLHTVDMLATANLPEVHCLAFEVEFAKPPPV